MYVFRMSVSFLNGLYGPILRPGNATDDIYSEMLSNSIDSALSKIVESNAAYSEYALSFQ